MYVLQEITNNLVNLTKMSQYFFKNIFTKFFLKVAQLLDLKNQIQEIVSFLLLNNKITLLTTVIKKKIIIDKH
jgi:hypothetical protein